MVIILPMQCTCVVLNTLKFNTMQMASDNGNEADENLEEFLVLI